MGNCLSSSTDDDISLLRGEQDQSDSVDSSLGPPPPYQESVHDHHHATPTYTSHRAQLSEEEQVNIAKRLGLISHLPTGIFDGSKKTRECVICMGEFMMGDPLRFLPCMHAYHKDCIDDWLMRSFTCPSCMEPVDAALLSLYESN